MLSPLVVLGYVIALHPINAGGTEINKFQKLNLKTNYDKYVVKRAQQNQVKIISKEKG